MGILTYQEIKNAKVKSTSYNMNCGTKNGLYLQVSAKNKGGAKVFVGYTYHFKSQKTVYLKSWGKGDGKLAGVREANDMWMKIRAWSEKTGRDPTEYKGRDTGVETLRDAFESWKKMKSKKIKESTMKEYTYKFYNHIAPRINPDTPLKPNLQYTTHNTNGRQEVLKMTDSIIASNPTKAMVDMAERCQDILRWVFSHAMYKQWMDPQTINPARREEGDPSADGESHYPAVDLEDAPKLFQKISLNLVNKEKIIVLATFFQLMTGLRPKTSALMQWDWITVKHNVRCFRIPADTDGLKRTGSGKKLEHYVPITPELNKLLKKIKPYSNGSNYLFPPVRQVNVQGKYPHMTPESVNNYLIRLRYQGKQSAHGFRTLMLTIGQDELDFDSEIIRRTMGHLLGDKTRQAYDRSLKLSARKKFCSEWHKYLLKNGIYF